MLRQQVIDQRRQLLAREAGSRDKMDLMERCAFLQRRVDELEYSQKVKARFDRKNTLGHKSPHAFDDPPSSQQ